METGEMSLGSMVGGALANGISWIFSVKEAPKRGDDQVARPRATNVRGTFVPDHGLPSRCGRAAPPRARTRTRARGRPPSTYLVSLCLRTSFRFGAVKAGFIATPLA